MKSIFIILCFSISLIPFTVFAQNSSQTTTTDSIRTFYDALFESLESEYLFTESIDWNSIKSAIMGDAIKANSFQESLDQTVTLFDTIKGDHLLLFTEAKMYQSTLKRQIAAEELSSDLIDVYNAEKQFEAKVINSSYGYVFIPGMLLLNATKKELDEASQMIYDAIIEIDQSQDIKGWIIDLRLNIGGNANVMLTGLYHLLGDCTTYLNWDVHNNLSVRCGLDNGVFYQNHEITTEVKDAKTPKPHIPVAFISGIMTASAGEFIVLGFRGREKITVIGEESYGLTTSNDLFELPYGTKAAITLGFATDRTSIFTKSIIPDKEIVRESNFKNLEKDKNVIEAIRFINENQK